jgi:hypothetical protein
MHVPLQSTIGGVHGVTHEPLMHVAPAEQAIPAEPWPRRPQPGVAPQFVLEALGSMQVVPHRINEPWQAQAPSKQTWPPGHIVPALLPWQVPDAPQWFGSYCGLVHVPLHERAHASVGASTGASALASPPLVPVSVASPPVLASLGPVASSPAASPPPVSPPDVAST